MPVKKGAKTRKYHRALPDPRMDLQKRRGQMRRLKRAVNRRLQRAVDRGSITTGRLESLFHMREMLDDEIDWLSRAIAALEDHGPPHQVRVPGSGERIRLYRRKRR